jgi:hypothetical protein
MPSPTAQGVAIGICCAMIVIALFVAGGVSRLISTSQPPPEIITSMEETAALLNETSATLLAMQKDRAELKAEIAKLRDLVEGSAGR